MLAHDWTRVEAGIFHDFHVAPIGAIHNARFKVEVYVEHLAIGAALPEMLLFLDEDRYINVPLESTYQAAYRGTPAFCWDVLGGRSPQVN